MIDFELSDEQKMVRDTVGAFAREQIRPAARQADEAAAIPPDLVQHAWNLGLVRGPVPEKLGGFGDQRSVLTGALAAEELAWGDLAIAMHVAAPQLFAFPIVEMGTDEQRQRFLPLVATDRFTAAGAATMEPRYDFDLSALATTATPDGSGFTLRGEKCCVPLADEARAFLVYAREEGASNGSAGGELHGLQAFIVEREASGLTVVEREKNMGLKALATYQLKLDDVKVSRDARLGAERPADTARLAAQSRVALAAMAVGVARAAFEYARDYAKERHAFGAPIATKQAIAFMLAEMALEVDAARLLTWQAASMLDKGLKALKESSRAKHYAASVALKVTDNALQILGGHGYIREHPVELWLRNARGFATFEGLAIV
jgi:alkylation response protein AidB-like acyl-CoA dehydrogenase